MKRLIFMGKHIMQAAMILFADNEDITTKQIASWPELEVTVREDGKYAVWVNLIDDAELLQDSRRDKNGILEKLLPYVDETIIDD